MLVTTRRQPVRIAPRAAGFIALLSLSLIAVLFPITPGQLSVREGDVASQSIRAPHAFTYNSDVLRRQLQQQALNSVPQSYSYNVNVKNNQLARLSDLLSSITSAKSDPNLSRQQVADALNSKGPAFTLEQRNAIASFTPDQWRLVSDEATRLLGAVLEEPFSAADLDGRIASLPNRVSAGLTATQGDVAVALVRGLVIATETVDTAATQRNREQTVGAVPPQQQSYSAKQVIVREGDVIDASKREALLHSGLLTVHLRWNDLGAAAVLTVVISTVLAAFLAIFSPLTFAAASKFVLLAVLIAAVVLLARLYMPQVLPDSRRQFLEFAFPAAAIPMLASALFDTGLAIMLSGVIALLVTFTALYGFDLSRVVGLSGLQPLEMTAAFFCAGLAGVLVVNRAERFNRFITAALAVAGATAAVLFAFWLLDVQRQPADLGWLLLAGGLAGVLSTLLTVGMFVLLGAVFNVSTRLQLMELAQLNQPLLRRLQSEAPGTFQHSVLVGNLAERAADLIGADSLLVRVGCYYHDVGKLLRPGFFIENQMGGQNPLNSMDPLVSNRVVQEHVRYGLELARKHRLPERVRAFIPEHHGTRLVTFFYRAAAKDDPDIDPSVFAYPGPPPQSKETAIAMLADSTEAIVRSSRDHSPERMDALIEGVIAERLAESQFDDCDLTLRDLRTIAESFKVTLRAIYHPRIEYPEPVEAERKRMQPTLVLDGSAESASAAPDEGGRTVEDAASASSPAAPLRTVGVAGNGEAEPTDESITTDVQAG